MARISRSERMRRRLLGCSFGPFVENDNARPSAVVLPFETPHVSLSLVCVLPRAVRDAFMQANGYHDSLPRGAVRDALWWERFEAASILASVALWWEVESNIVGHVVGRRPHETHEEIVRRLFERHGGKR